MLGSCCRRYIPWPPLQPCTVSTQFPNYSFGVLWLQLNSVDLYFSKSHLRVFFFLTRFNKIQRSGRFTSLINDNPQFQEGIILWGQTTQGSLYNVRFPAYKASPPAAVPSKQSDLSESNLSSCCALIASNSAVLVGAAELAVVECV
jgi:hypothetical protein